ncbi:MAG: hypothetical protein KJ067_13965 [Vicinamibacteria bacterium]|nr:hypothetical protein [Vicinamibacteria bacterium]
MTEWLVMLAVSVAVLLVWLWADGRRQQQAVLRDWDMVLTQRGASELREAQGRVNADLALIDATWDAAGNASAEGSRERAVALLELGCGLVESYCPKMISTLRALSVLSRMASAIAPPPPLRPSAFQLGELTGLARLHQFGHHLLVSMHERFRWKLLVLQHCFGTLARVVVARTRGAIRAQVPEQALPTVKAARSDLHVLSDETVAAMHAWLISVAADPKADPER